MSAHYRGAYMITATPTRQIAAPRQVVAVGAEAVERHPPGDRADDEHAAVGGKHATELVLGLKGTMSEAELHLLAGRLQGAKRAAAARGELRCPLPIGYVYDAEGKVAIDPDEEVSAAIADLFAAFDETGSAYGTVGALADRPFPKRAYGGAWAGELRWGRLTHSRVRGVLHNPVYAGAYVYGRHRSRRLVAPDGTIRTTTVELPRAEWEVVIQDHHPAYIDWETFLRNEARLEPQATAAHAGRGGRAGPPPRRAGCAGATRSTSPPYAEISLVSLRATSANRHSALTSRICSIDVAWMSSKRGLQTRTAGHRDSDVEAVAAEQELDVSGQAPNLGVARGGDEDVLGLQRMLDPVWSGRWRSIGLICAVPVTTALAAILAETERESRAEPAKPAPVET